MSNSCQIHIKYIPILNHLRHVGYYNLNTRKTIYIFYCEDNKYFITYANANISRKTSTAVENIIPVPIPINGEIDIGDLPISFFVNKNCPDLNECDFIKKHKIIGMKEIKSLIIYDLKKNHRDHYLRLTRQISDCQIVKLLEIYENTLDNLIIKYMHKYGIDNVRGGSFSGLILSKDQLKQINQIKYKLLKESNLDQIDGETNLNFDDKEINLDYKEINLNLTTKYLNMDFIEKEIIKYKTELADFRTELADVRAELAEFKTKLAKPTSDLNNLDTLD